MVEIEPNVSQLRVLQLIDKLSELLSYSQLTALLVNQIHEDLLSIASLDLSEVPFSCFNAIVELRLHNDLRVPFHGRFLRPNQGNGASDLTIGAYLELSSVIDCQNALCLNEISRISLGV